MLTPQKFQKIVNIVRAVGQEPKEHKEISQMHYKILRTKLFAAADIKIRKNRPILTFEGP